MSRFVAHAGLWSALAFVFNLTWEIAHVRLYTIWAAADGMGVAWALFHCTLGDVVIALVMFVLAGMMLGRADWPVWRPWPGGVIVVIGANPSDAHPVFASRLKRRVREGAKPCTEDWGQCCSVSTRCKVQIQHKILRGTCHDSRRK